MWEECGNHNISLLHAQAEPTHARSILTALWWLCILHATQPLVVYTTQAHMHILRAAARAHLKLSSWAGATAMVVRSDDWVFLVTATKSRMLTVAGTSTTTT